MNNGQRGGGGRAGYEKPKLGYKENQIKSIRMPCQKRFEKKCVRMQFDCCTFTLPIVIPAKLMRFDGRTLSWANATPTNKYVWAIRKTHVFMWNPPAINHGLALLGTKKNKIKKSEVKKTVETICPPHVSLKYISRCSTSDSANVCKLFPPISEYSARSSVIQYLWLHLCGKKIRLRISFLT